MCSRDIMDRKNDQKIENICKNSPSIVTSYIISMTKKTSYTKKAYAYYTHSFLQFLLNNKHMNIFKDDIYKQIKPMDIDEYIDTIKYNSDGSEKSATYITAQLAAINGFFKFLQRNGFVDVNPCTDTEVPKDNKIHNITVIDTDDMKTIMNNIKNGVGSQKAISTQTKWINRDISFVTIGVTTGLRLSAIVGLDLKDIDFNDNSIIVTEKGNIQRKVYFGDNTSAILKKWIADRSKMTIADKDALFIAQGGRRMATRTAQDLMKRITNGTQKHITPHKMRATCATRLYDATGDIYRVQAQLGHKNIENTKKYAMISESKKIESAKILDSII